MRKAAKRALESLGYQAEELSLALVTDEEMARLNQRFLGRKGSTDVLAFPMAENGTGSSRLLGDVVISVERALAQAKRGPLGLDKELLTLLVHGILHLSGYCHAGSRKEARRMAAAEKRLRAELADLLPFVVESPP